MNAADITDQKRTLAKPERNEMNFGKTEWDQK
jgi:hypothetical protein